MKTNLSPEELVRKYNQGICSEEECAWIESWHLKDLAESTYVPTKEHISSVNERMFKALSIHITPTDRPTKIISLWPYLTGAACLLLLIAGLSYFYKNHTDPDPNTLTTYTDILPGRNHAVLTLSDGKKIVLSRTNPGLLTKQGGMQVLNDTAKGQLVYYGAKSADRVIAINTLETPRGGQYQVTLPDGTKVWLNSASSLRYPIRFTGNERKVELSGEAYFEVTKNKEKPFRINSTNQVVEVLGTHFNISAYPDEEQSATTLLEGKIRIHKMGIQKILKPGQEAVVNTFTTDIQVRSADLEKNTAWKNNEFIFNGEDIRHIMRSIARWYNVDISYLANPDQTRYWGVLSRSNNLSSVLKMLESTGKVTFKVKGRRITVMN